MYQWIKTWRNEAGMTQQELAEKVYITPQAISLMEKGKRNVSLSQLEDIAAACGRKMTLFFGDQLCVEELKEEEVFQKMNQYFYNMWKKEELMIWCKEEIEHIISVKGNAVLGRLSGMENSRVVQELIKEMDNVRPLHEAKAVLLHLEGNSGFKYEQLDEASHCIHEKVNAMCNIMVSTSINQENEEGFILRVMAVGYDSTKC